MRLFIEKHPELTKLSLYFREMEFLADKFGIVLDDHRDDHKILQLITPNLPATITGINKGLTKLPFSSEKKESIKTQISVLEI